MSPAVSMLSPAPYYDPARQEQTFSGSALYSLPIQLLCKTIDRKKASLILPIRRFKSQLTVTYFLRWSPLWYWDISVIFEHLVIMGCAWPWAVMPAIPMWSSGARMKHHTLITKESRGRNLTCQLRNERDKRAQYRSGITKPYCLLDTQLRSGKARGLDIIVITSWTKSCLLAHEEDIVTWYDKITFDLGLYEALCAALSMATDAAESPLSSTSCCILLSWTETVTMTLFT